MRVLVIGAGGMAGHVVAISLREQGHAVDSLSAKNKLDDATYLQDVTDADNFKKFLDSHEYDVVVNCIGVLVNQSEEKKDLAVYLNAYLPHFLESYYRDSKTRVIHLSTDCVFSGKNPPYNENSEYDGELFYDRSKALGELRNDKDLTFRMSIIGPDMNENGTGLFNWFAAQTGDISGYAHAMWTGVTTIELAKAINAALEQNLTGLYHLVPGTNISKFDLLNLFKEVYGRDEIRISKDTSARPDKTLISTREDFNYTVPDYRSMVEEMKSWTDSHKSIYKHYR